MRNSILRILILVAVIGIPLAVGLFIYWHSMLPDPDSKIQATPQKGWSDEKVLEMY